MDIYTDTHIYIYIYRYICNEEIANAQKGALRRTLLVSRPGLNNPLRFE